MLSLSKNKPCREQGYYRPRTGTSRYDLNRKGDSAGSPIISGPVSKEASTREPGLPLGRLTENPPSNNVPQPDNPVNKKPKKDVKKSAKRWIWIDSNGKIWIKKSVMEAWRQARTG